MDISEEDYKLAKEAHVANCTGGSISEVSMVCASLVSSHMVWSALVKYRYIEKDSFMPQFILYVLVVLSCLTWAADYATFVTVGTGTIALMISLLSTETVKAKENESKQENYKSFLTVYRAGTMISTCIAILAVDFQFFPRRFAKVETFGTSLMDAGVGSFVFSSGIVAARAYASTVHESLFKSMLKSFRSAGPILALGFARFFLTKSVNYQEHNSEYGLHWNFFFTLGFLPPFVTLIGSCRRILPFSALAFLIAVGYQFALNQGLEHWILNAPRVDILSANKEGVCSLAGYLAIFMFGLQCGVVVFQKDVSNSIMSRWLGISKKDENKQLTVQLYTYSLIMWIFFYTYEYLFPKYQVSRRMANLPYIFWVIAFNLSLIASLVLVDNKNNIKGRGPPLLDAININGLFTFLLANILTGSINLGMRTLYANGMVSGVVNILYMLIVTMIPWFMWRKYNLRIKL